MMGMRRAFVVGLVIQVGLATLRPATSRADGGEPAREAAAHFDRGVKLYEEQDWRAALIEFERAYAVSPHYRVLYDIGQCRYQLRDYVGALTAFQKYLAEGGAEIPSTRRDQVQATADELKARIAQVRVTCDTAGAQVLVDDVPAGVTPLAAPLRVSAGRRRIMATKGGRSSGERVIDVAGDDVVDVALRIAPPDASTAPVPPRSQGRAGRALAPAIVGLSLGAAGLVVGTVFGVLAIDDKRRLDLACTGFACPASSQPLIDEAQRNALVSTVGFIAGAAGVLGAAGYWWFSPPADGARAGFSLRPAVGMATAGAVGRF